MKFETNRLILKSICIKDATDVYLNWLKEFGEDGLGLIMNSPKNIKELKYYIRSKKKQNILFLGIFLKYNMKHIGNIKFEPLDFKNNKTTMGVLIGDKKWRSNGVFMETMDELEKYFVKKNINKIFLGVDINNKHAVHVYKKSNFRVISSNKNSLEMLKIL